MTPEAEKNENPDFKYMVRIIETDIDGNLPLVLALQRIGGIGQRIAESAAKKEGISPVEKIGNLSDEDIERLDVTLRELQKHMPVWMLNRRKDYDTGADLHLVGNDLKMRHEDDINRLRKIRSYRGIRHETGHKVRGQRTRSNGRKGLTLGVSRKKN